MHQKNDVGIFLTKQTDKAKPSKQTPFFMFLMLKAYPKETNNQQVVRSLIRPRPGQPA